MLHTPKLKAVLTVYVDDFKLAAPTSCIADAWQAMKDRGMDIGAPQDASLFMGCQHEKQGR